MPEFKNLVLRNLPAEVLTRLHLHPARLKQHHEIEYPGQPIAHLFFLEEGMASITNTFKDGSQVEVGMFGYESVIGVSAFMGTRLSLNRVYMQIAGHGYRCSFANAMQEFERGGEFHDLSLRYVQAQLVQAMQSAGCNARHELPARLARWLLLCADRVHRDGYAISHEILSEMLGATRSSVTRACRVLKLAGALDYSRGEMRLLDRPQLERRACECYRTIRDYLASFTEFDTGITK